MVLWRTAFRSVAGRPALAGIIVVTLAIGIGANSAIFSAVDTVLLRPLPYPESDRLVAVYERNLARPQATQLLAPGRLEEWNALNHTFTALAATYFENMTDTSCAEPERVAAMRTSPRFFDVLGVPPALGRTPAPGEERFGGPSVAVASDGYWRTRLGADPRAIGRRLVLGGSAVTVIGVMPPSFRYPSATTELWVPTKAPQFFLEARAARLYTAIGRLKPGVTLQQATADLDGVQGRLGDQYPETDRGWGATLVAVKEEQVAGVRRSLWVLFAAVGLLLIAACGTVACLLLADSARRQHEIAVRLALGADRARVVSQLLGEGIVLAAGGIAAGLIVAVFGIRALRAFATQLPRVSDLALDARLVAVTLAGGIATTLLFALAPAWRASRVDPATALARRGRGHTNAGGRLQQSLVAAQIALAAVLLVGAVLLIRSFEQLQAVSPGFDPTGVLTFRMSAQWSERTSAVVGRQARTVARLSAIPGVDAAAFSQQLPAGIAIPPGEFSIVGRDSREKTFSSSRAVGPGYFRTLHIPLLSGDTCSADPATPPYTNAIVSRAFVTRYFPDANPLGHALTAAGFPPGTQAKIIGVAGDVRENGITTAAGPLIYWCGYNPYWPDVYFLVRTATDHPATLADIRSAMREIEPGRAVYSVRTLPDLLAESTAQQRLTTVLVALFGATALLLAALGLSGVLSQAVSARQREFGIRLAVGATPGSIVRLVLRHAAVVVGAGLVIGTATALASARVLAALLFGVAPRDPLTFTLVPLFLIATALAAAALPARRAATVDPIEPLRAD